MQGWASNAQQFSASDAWSNVSGKVQVAASGMMAAWQANYALAEAACKDLRQRDRHPVIERALRELANTAQGQPALSDHRRAPRSTAQAWRAASGAPSCHFVRPPDRTQRGGLALTDEVWAWWPSLRSARRHLHTPAPRSPPGSWPGPTPRRSGQRGSPQRAPRAPPQPGTTARRPRPPPSPTAPACASSSCHSLPTRRPGFAPRSSAARPAPTAPVPGRSPPARSGVVARSPAAPP